MTSGTRYILAVFAYIIGENTAETDRNNRKSKRLRDEVTDVTIQKERTNHSVITATDGITATNETAISSDGKFSFNFGFLDH